MRPSRVEKGKIGPVVATSSYMIAIAIDRLLAEKRAGNEQVGCTEGFIDGYYCLV